MNEEVEINVCIGEVKLGRPGERLRAILGSCVGIGLVWRDRRRIALAHCLLAEAPRSSREIDGRFVTQAVPSLLALLHARPGDYGEIEAIVAGGGNMTSPNAKDETKLVGAVNVATALRLLEKLGIRVVHQETGGREGRVIVLHGDTYLHEIRRLERLAA
ncbi:MAG: chemotaxis protein CheD [Bdellovibrionales bacterium]|nr:chemotaxis protein CheD [Bdellovibrionales bacterium]